MNQPVQQKPQFPTLDILTGVGTFVSGDFHTFSDKGYKGQVRKKPQIWFMFALPKTDQSINNLFGGITQHAFQSYQWDQGVQAIIMGDQRSGRPPFRIGDMPPPGYEAGPFAWKIEDGDHPDNRDKPGRAGCWLMKFGSTYKFTVWSPNAQEQLDPASIPLGTRIQVDGTCVINGNGVGTCGIYLNPRRVRVVEAGPLIVNQGDGRPASEVFGQWANTNTPVPDGMRRLNEGTGSGGNGSWGQSHQPQGHQPSQNWGQNNGGGSNDSQNGGHQNWGASNSAPSQNQQPSQNSNGNWNGGGGSYNPPAQYQGNGGQPNQNNGAGASLPWGSGNANGGGVPDGASAGPAHGTQAGGWQGTASPSNNQQQAQPNHNWVNGNRR